MKNEFKIIIGVGVISVLLYLLIKYKKTPVIKDEKKQVVVDAVINGEKKKLIATVPVSAPYNNTPGNNIIPEIPTKYADGTAVPNEVLQNTEYINAWNAFYQNTIFPPGDPRNTLTPSGGIVIGDGNGGFWNPNA